MSRRNNDIRKSSTEWLSFYTLNTFLNASLDIMLLRTYDCSSSIITFNKFFSISFFIFQTILQDLFCLDFEEGAYTPFFKVLSHYYLSSQYIYYARNLEFHVWTRGISLLAFWVLWNLPILEFGSHLVGCSCQNPNDPGKDPSGLESINSSHTPLSPPWRSSM